MKKYIIALATGLISLTACQQNATKENKEVQELAQEAIRIHDEIMPQISLFDRTTVRIDSILVIENSEERKADLISLKTNLENATDEMMSWMRDYAMDSTDVAYQKVEVERITKLKRQFEEVSLESNQKLGSK